MSDTIKATVEFSYKGEYHAPSAEIDLDGALRSLGKLPDFYVLLARESGIDTYSYLYEVMTVHGVSFSDATGLATEFLVDGGFDGEGYVQRWREQQALSVLQPIARDYMGVEELANEPALQAALQAAYRAGRDGRAE